MEQVIAVEETRFHIHAPHMACGHWRDKKKETEREPGPFQGAFIIGPRSSPDKGID